MNRYLKVNELENGYIYKIEARNASIGVWLELKKAFIISRWKFKSNYLTHEYHWDIDDTLGTAKPMEILEKFPFELKDYSIEDRQNSKILKYLDSFDDTRDESIERLGWNDIQQKRLDKKKIGIFWIYEKQVFLEFQILGDIKAINGFKDSDLSYYQVWDKVKNQHPKFYLYEYEDIPRGRVVYDIENHIFRIYCNENILQDETSKKLILEKFKLMKLFEVSKESIEFKKDEHYKII